MWKPFAGWRILKLFRVDFVQPATWNGAPRPDRHSHWCRVAFWAAYPRSRKQGAGCASVSDLSYLCTDLVCLQTINHSIHRFPAGGIKFNRMHRYCTGSRVAGGAEATLLYAETGKTHNRFLLSHYFLLRNPAGFKDELYKGVECPKCIGRNLYVANEGINASRRAGKPL